MTGKETILRNANTQTCDQHFHQQHSGTWYDRSTSLPFFCRLHIWGELWVGRERIKKTRAGNMAAQLDSETRAKGEEREENELWIWIPTPSSEARPPRDMWRRGEWDSSLLIGGHWKGRGGSTLPRTFSHLELKSLSIGVLELHKKGVEIAKCLVRKAKTFALVCKLAGQYII